MPIAVEKLKVPVRTITDTIGDESITLTFDPNKIVAEVERIEGEPVEDSGHRGTNAPDLVAEHKQGSFQAECNRIGADLGLPPVTDETAPYWPHALRPRGWYSGRYADRLDSVRIN